MLVYVPAATENVGVATVPVITYEALAREESTQSGIHAKALMVELLATVMALLYKVLALQLNLLAAHDGLAPSVV